jgi:hypothetical protein
MVSNFLMYLEGTLYELISLIKKRVGYYAYSMKRAREIMFIYRCKILLTLKE